MAEPNAIIPTIDRRLSPANVACACLFLIAAFLRLYRPELVSFTADEGIHGVGAASISVFESFPMVGLPSVGIRNSALFLYVLAIPNLIWFHPLSGVIFVALVNLAAMALAWRIGKRVFGPWPTLVGMTLLTFAPWGVLYARNMWPPSCVVILCLWTIDSALLWLNDGSPRRLCWTIVLAFVCPQMHFSGFCAPVWLTLVLLIGRRRISWTAIVAGIVLGFATWGPWIYWQHFINRWQDIVQLLRNAKGTTTLAATVTSACQWWGVLLGSNDFDYWFGFTPEQLPELFPNWLIVGNRWLGMLLVAVAVVSCVWFLMRGSREARLLVVWSIMPIGMLAVLRPAMHPHYVWVAFPIPFLLIGGGMGDLIGRIAVGGKRRLAVTICVLWLTTTAAFEVGSMKGWFEYVAADRPTGAGHFQLSLRQRFLAVGSIMEDWKTSNANGISGYFSGEQPAYGYVFHYYIVSGRLARRPIDESLTYWVDEDHDEPLGNGALATLRDWKGFPNPTVVKQWRVGSSRIFLVRKESLRP